MRETPVNLVQVVVGPTGFVGASEPAVVAYIRSSFVDRPKPDLIVSIGGPAAVFRAQVSARSSFPTRRPCSRPWINGISVTRRLARTSTAVAVVNDYPGVVEDILQLLPQTRQVFVVTGSGQIGRFWHRELEDTVQAISTTG